MKSNSVEPNCVDDEWDVESKNNWTSCAMADAVSCDLLPPAIPCRYCQNGRNQIMCAGVLFSK